MNLDQNHAMVVLSGGQDSTTCLGWALAQYGTVSAVSFDYGQKHKIELAAASSVIDYFEQATGRTIKHEVVNMGAGIFAGTSPLTNPNETLETYADHAEMEQVIGDRVEKTFVPMRNAVFLMLAANRAVVAGAGVLVTGVCQEDNANYPDCRLEFVDSANNTIQEALDTEFFVDTPLMQLSKAESVQLALELPHTYAALAWSHTAYNGEYPPVSHDHASVLRAHGFEVAGVPDPLVLRAVREGLMPLPETSNYKEEWLPNWDAEDFAVAWRNER